MSTSLNVFQRVIHSTGSLTSRSVPAAIDISVTDYCNADCSFCGFRKSVQKGNPRRFLEIETLQNALSTFKASGIKFVNFQGGEPLLHPQILEAVQSVKNAGMKPSLITNGFQLPRMAEDLAKHGLHNLLISIDSHDPAIHEENRGLKGVIERIKDGIGIMKRYGIPVIASTTLSHLVDIDKFPDFLKELGFSGVTFSYPRQAPLGGSSLVYNEETPILEFSQEDFIAKLDQIKKMKDKFPVLNSVAGLSEIKRHTLRQKEFYPCVGGYKYYYMDWNGDLWRCENWNKSYGHISKHKVLPVDRSYCTSCIMSCYRDTSALMYAPLTFGDVLSGDKPAKELVTPAFMDSVVSGAKDSLLILNLFKGAKKGR